MSSFFLKSESVGSPALVAGKHPGPQETNRNGSIARGSGMSATGAVNAVDIGSLHHKHAYHPPGKPPPDFFAKDAKGAYYLIVIMLTIACQQRWFLKQQLTFSERERR